MPLLTKAIVPEEFDWENIDYMPTPPEQAPIPVPWGNQGSISGFYGADVVYDYRMGNGWYLVYSSFRDSGEELIDPYFMLYNVYRGTLRIYFYLTSTFIGESTYLKDALTFSGSNGITSNILNYLPGGITDTSKDIETFSQIQPKMYNGGSPLASKRWYMIEYEMAYDPNLSNWDSTQAYLYWTLDYVNVLDITLNGSEKSDIYGTIGGAGNFWNDAVGNVAEGTLSVLGLDLLNNLKEDDGEEDDKNNKLGIGEIAFNGLINGITSVVNSIGSGLPNIVIEFISSIFGGSDNTSGTTVSLKTSSTVKLDGSLTSQGAVSSTPIDIKIPGTNIASDATGFIPLYEDPFGVFYWDGGNVTVNIMETITVTRLEDDIMGTGTYNVYSSTAVAKQQDYSQYVIVNPAVSKIANVSIISQEPKAIYKESGSITDFPLTGVEYDSPYEGDSPMPEISGVAIHVVIKVAPKDGGPASYISKTFLADDYKWTTRYNYAY